MVAGNYSSLERPSDIEVDGVFNVRDFGGHKAGGAWNTFTRRDFLYRSGHLDSITATGKQQLLDLNLSTIFDFRTKAESESYRALNNISADSAHTVNSLRQQPVIAIKHVAAPMREQDSPSQMLEKYGGSSASNAEVRFIS
jgi:protein tyrosine/serine phosphatase